MLSPCRSAIRWVWDNLLIRPAPRCLDPYGSHVPVLLILATCLKPRRVLELGCGVYSTLTFLDVHSFPSLEHLVSVETDPEWLERVGAMVRSDPRWQPRMVEGASSVADWLRFGGTSLAIDEFDLILVDDSANDIQRRQTLGALFCARPTPPIVVHDVECARLRTRLWTRRPYVVFDAFNPQTGLCNLGAGSELSKLKHANAVLRTLRNQALAARNLQEWVAVGRAAIGQLDMSTHIADLKPRMTRRV